MPLQRLCNELTSKPYSALCRAVQDGVLLPELPNFMQYYTLRDVHVFHTSSTHRPHAHVVCTLSAPACCPHVIWTHHLHLHVIRTCTCHPHIICSTPCGQHGPKLFFYSDRIWLLNGICHKNVELFHFRII